MTIEEIRAQLAALVGKLDATEDIEDAKSIAEEIKSLKAKEAVMAEKAAILDSMKAGAPVPVKGGDAKAANLTIGQKAAAAVAEKGFDRASRDSVTVAAKAEGYNAVPAGYVPATTEYVEGVIEGPRRAMTIADLFSQETTERQAVTYYVESVASGEPETVAEGGKYPLLTFGDPTPKTDPVKKIGCIYKDTDELLDDAPRLAQQIDNRAMYLMDVAEEDQLLIGDGTGNNIVGLLNRSGLQTATATMGVPLIEAIKAAKAGIKKNTPKFAADAVVINDEDWDELTNTKDSNGNYLIGNPFTVDGEGSKPWGLNVVPTSAIAKGTVVVGAFKMGGSVIRNGGRSVEVTNSNDKDFENGLLAFRPSERIALAVRYPAAFVKIAVSDAA